MLPFSELGSRLGLQADEMIPHGRWLGRVDHRRVLDRLADAPRARYINVTAITAITSTPLGEGKTTTTLGLIQGRGAIGKRATGAIRRPSGGPTFNTEGSAAVEADPGCRT